MEQFPLIIRVDRAATVRMTGDRGESVRLIDEDSDFDRLNLRLNRLESDGPGRHHHHPKSDLLCYVVSGRLELTTPHRTEILESGDAAFIPAGMEHAIRKVSDQTLSLLEVYVPGSPEFVYT